MIAFRFRSLDSYETFPDCADIPDPVGSTMLQFTALIEVRRPGYGGDINDAHAHERAPSVLERPGHRSFDDVVHDQPTDDQS